ATIRRRDGPGVSDPSRAKESSVFQDRTNHGRREIAAQPSSAPLPMTREEMAQRGWAELDVLLVTGDAYVDHPSFGAALLGRWLSAKGIRVGIVAQPGWDDPSDVARLGRPRLF